MYIPIHIRSERECEGDEGQLHRQGQERPVRLDGDHQEDQNKGELRHVKRQGQVETLWMRRMRMRKWKKRK